jgi:hypothetical protein
MLYVFVEVVVMRFFLFPSFEPKKLYLRETLMETAMHHNRFELIEVHGYVVTYDWFLSHRAFIG